MGLVHGVIRHPVSVLMLFIVAVSMSLFVTGSLSIDLLPAITRSVIVVSTSYGGAGPEEVERTVTDPLEDALSNVPGVETVTSTSSEGSSRINLEFHPDINLDDAAADVRDRLEFVRNRLPDGADSPRVLKFDSSNWPIMNIALRGDRSVDELRVIAEEYVRNQLEQVSGVGSAELRGGRTPQVSVQVQYTALRALGLTLADVARGIRQQNTEASGGQVMQGERRTLVRTTGQYRNVDDIRSVVVTYAKSSTGDRLSAAGPRPVLLGEIATVTFGPDTQSQRVRVNGAPGVYLAVQKESGANTVAVVDGILDRLGEIRQSLPTGVDLIVVNDSSTSIRTSLNQVISSLISGGILTLCVLIFFLRNTRATIIVAVSIPVSLLLTLLGMFFSGMTLNVISMSGLILGIGMVVDSSVVVLENIYRFRQAGMNPHKAALMGAREMIMPIMASALTTICVFLPVLIFRRQLGDFSVIIGDIAFTVVVAILASLAAAILLVPVLASTFLPIKITASNDKKGLWLVVNRISTKIENLLLKLESGYTHVLGKAIHHRLLVLVVIVSLFLASASVLFRLNFVFSPSAAEDSVTLNLNLREGTSIDVTDKMVQDLIRKAREENPDIQDIIYSVGSGSGTSLTNTHSGQITFKLPPAAPAKLVEGVQQSIRGFASQQPGLQVSFRQNRGLALSRTNPVDIVLRSDDLASLNQAASDILRLIRQDFPEITEPRTDQSEGLPELRIRVQRERAYDFGISIDSVVQEIKSTMDGVNAGAYRLEGQEYPILVTLQPQDRASALDLERFYVRSQTGVLIPVSSLAVLERGGSPTSIRREDKQRTLRITASLAPGFTAAELSPRLEAAIAGGVAIPDSVSLRYAGEAQAAQETGSQMGLLVAMAVFLVFAVMASQFESFRSPFIVFFTIPLMFVGVPWVYLATGLPLSMFSLLGLVLLAGIVVNNGIVLVDAINLARVRGAGLAAAILDSARGRLRPILITTVTTVLGMVPMAFFPGQGAQITQPVGLTIVGGLTASTALSLFVVPILYGLIAGKTAPRKVDPNAANMEEDA